VHTFSNKVFERAEIARCQHCNDDNLKILYGNYMLIRLLNAQIMTKHVCKISRWNSKLLLRNPQKILGGYFILPHHVYKRPYNNSSEKNWISSHRTQTTTSQYTKLLSQHHPLCSHLGFIFDKHLSALSKSCNFHIRQLCCIHPFLDIKTASTPLPPLSFTPNLITATHYITISPTHSYPGFNTSRTLLFVQLLKLPSSLTPLLFSNLCTAWLKVNERIESLSHMQDSLHCSICLSPSITWSLFSLLAALVRHLSSPSLVHPHLPLSKSQIALSVMHHPSLE